MISSILILAALATGAVAETFSGIASWHDDWSETACGGAADGTAFIMALNPDQFGGGANPNLAPACGKTITVNHEGKSIVVTVVSKGGMPLNDFDLSKPAFEQLASTDKGTIPVTWSWNDFDPATDDTAGAAVSPVAAVSSSASSTLAAATTALAAGADAAVAPAASSVASIAPDGTSITAVAPVAPDISSAASSASAGHTARPTGYRGGGRQSKRCAAQL